MSRWKPETLSTFPPASDIGDESRGPGSPGPWIFDESACGDPTNAGHTSGIYGAL